MRRQAMKLQLPKRCVSGHCRCKRKYVNNHLSGYTEQQGSKAKRAVGVLVPQHPQSESYVSRISAAWNVKSLQVRSSVEQSQQTILFIVEVIEIPDAQVAKRSTVCRDKLKQQRVRWSASTLAEVREVQHLEPTCRLRRSSSQYSVEVAESLGQSVVVCLQAAPEGRVQRPKARPQRGVSQRAAPGAADAGAARAVLDRQRQPDDAQRLLRNGSEYRGSAHGSRVALAIIRGQGVHVARARGAGARAREARASKRRRPLVAFLGADLA